MGVALVAALVVGVVMLRPAPVVEPVVIVPPPVVVVVDAGAPAVVVVAEAQDAAVEEEPLDAGESVAVAEEPDAGAKVPKVPVQKPVELTQQIVQATLERERKNIKVCLQSYRSALSPAAGAVRVKWGIETNGSVSTVEVLEPAGLKGTPLEACLIKRVKAFRFPRNNGPAGVKITQPFTYTAVE